MNALRPNQSVVQTHSATTPLETTTVHAGVDIMSLIQVWRVVLTILVQVRLFLQSIESTLAHLKTIFCFSKHVFSRYPFSDINECVEISNVCGFNSNCTNYNGSYNCSCLSGYQVTRANQSIILSNQCTGKWKHKCFRCLSLKMLPDLFFPSSTFFNSLF